MYHHRNTYFDSGEIRTHEANALDLKTNPFDRSGTLSLINFVLLTIIDFLKIKSFFCCI